METVKSVVTPDGNSAQEAVYDGGMHPVGRISNYTTGQTFVHNKYCACFLFHVHNKFLP
jgi:hypothetical protein